MELPPGETETRLRGDHHLFGSCWHRRQPPTWAEADRKIEVPATFHAPAARCCDTQGVALRCLIVDDNHEFLAAASKLLEQEGVSVVGVASTSADAIQMTAELQPEVILVD